MHEYLTIENLLKRYLVTFTIKIHATGTNWVFEMRQICQIWLFYQILDYYFLETLSFRNHVVEHILTKKFITESKLYFDICLI